MKISTLWNQVKFIYDNYDFSNRLINDTLIISRDNYYYLCWSEGNSRSVSLRLEINFNISKMKSEYKAEINGFGSEFTDYIPDEFLNDIIPILRDFQLDTILE